uniref:hypothetical protein n=1 Tax=Flavobacterium sp. TaxID=239 RepID=UPI00404A2FE4
MKNLELNQMVKIVGGDDIDDFVGGLACGAALAGVFTLNPMAWIPAIGCANYIRNNW